MKKIIFFIILFAFVPALFFVSYKVASEIFFAESETGETFTNSSYEKIDFNMAEAMKSVHFSILHKNFKDNPYKYAGIEPKISKMDVESNIGMKWWGGVLHSSGKVVFIPYFADSTVIFDSENVNNPFEYISFENKSKKIELYRGGISTNGKVYCVPFNSDYVLEIDPIVKKAEMKGAFHSGNKKWSGAVFASGKIYGIPYNELSVLAFDPSTGNSRTFGAEWKLSEKNKWSGGVLGFNEKIYCVPFDYDKILRIEPGTDKIKMLKENYGSEQGKWSGGVLGFDGKIYGVPYNSNNLLIFDPKTESSTLLEIPEQFKGKNKWNGGTIALDGRIYFVPYESKFILVFNPYTNEFDGIPFEKSGTGSFVGGVMNMEGNVVFVPFDSREAMIVETEKRTNIKETTGILAPSVNKF